MPKLAERPLLAILAAGLVGLVLGYASEAAAEGGGSGSRREIRAGSADLGFDVRRSAIGRSADGIGQRRTLRGRDVDAGARGFHRRGYRDLDAARNIYRVDGSLTYVRSHRRFANRDRDERIDDAYDGFAVPVAPDGIDAPPPGSFPSEPRFIDISTERLDRRPIGPDGIDIVHTGGVKIIRVGQDGPFRRLQRRPEARRIEADALQPWSSGWLTHCMAAYASFDPALGTYVARDGRVRFCEAE